MAVLSPVPSSVPAAAATPAIAAIAPIVASASTSSSDTNHVSSSQVIMLVCLIVAALLFSLTAMSLTIWCMWRNGRIGSRSEDNVEANHSDEDRSHVTACRKPVVIINPSQESISYGRRESSYFPSFFRLGPRTPNLDLDAELPEAADGGYYSKGEPGFFEIDLDLSHSDGKNDV